MKYRFVQSVHIAGTDYRRGVHDVSEKVENHPHFLKFVGAGFIVEADPSGAVDSASFLQRMHDKVSKKVAPAVLVPEPPKASLEAPVVASEEEAPVEAPVKESKKKPKAPKG